MKTAVGRVVVRLVHLVGSNKEGMQVNTIEGSGVRGKAEKGCFVESILPNRRIVYAVICQHLTLSFSSIQLNINNYIIIFHISIFLHP